MCCERVRGCGEEARGERYINGRLDVGSGRRQTSGWLVAHWTST